MPDGRNSENPAMIWALYNEKSTSYDAALVSRIKGSMDPILVFVRRVDFLFIGLTNISTDWSVLCRGNSVHHRELQAA